MVFGVKKSFFGRLQEKIEDVLFMRPEIDEDMLDALEEVLIISDIGMETTMHIVGQLREDIKKDRIADPEGVKAQIVEIVKGLVDKGDRHKIVDAFPLVIMMIGVNGGGKTTTIAKLANRFVCEGKTVLLAAADTFRAAAGEQLEIWADRVGVNVIRHQEGADPSAVIYDAIQSAKAKNIDVLICDTAGRLQTKKNLMAELEKMNKIIAREHPEAARETLLVLDATTGKNAVSQAKEFGEAADITGIVLTKMDGTAKGGIVITVSDEFDLPVKLMGVGEKMEDLIEFEPAAFAASIFAEDAEESGDGEETGPMDDGAEDTSGAADLTCDGEEEAGPMDDGAEDTSGAAEFTGDGEETGPMDDVAEDTSSATDFTGDGEAAAAESESAPAQEKGWRGFFGRFKK